MADFFSGLFGGLGRASQFKYAGEASKARGLAQKNALYSQAGALEQDVRANQAIDAYNMSQVRDFQRRSEARAFNASANSGFLSDSGTAGAGVSAIRRTMDERVANMGMDSAMASRNAMNRAENLRLEGDNALRAGEAEAAMYRMLAKSTRQGAILNAVGSVVSGAGAAVDAWQYAGGYNDFVGNWNKKNPLTPLGKVNQTRSALAGGFAGLNGYTNPFSF